MSNYEWDSPTNLKIGIVGCGHLGQAIAHALIDRGFEIQNLYISYRANPSTYEKLKEQGLISCVSTNQEIFQKSDIILITIRPQDLTSLTDISITEKVLVVSCMAGVPTDLLNQLIGKNTYRMMFSGPDTIVSGKGVGAMYPEHNHLKMLLHFLNLRHIKTTTENDLDIYTTGVCMPAAIIKIDDSIQQQNAIEKIGT